MSPLSQRAALGLVALAALVPLFWRTGLDIDSLIAAEDGFVFANQARYWGLSAIVMPAQGYLHLYPRLVAALADGFGFGWVPAFYLSGWLAVYALVAGLVIRFLARHGVGPAGIAVAWLAIVWQPHTSEVYLTLTNAQWVAGLGLCVLLLGLGSSGGWRWVDLGLIVLFGLTGPFSTVLVPVALALSLIEGNLRHPPLERLALTATGLVQAAVLVLAPRDLPPGEVAGANEVAMAAARALTFGADSLVAWLAVAAVAGAILAGGIRQWRDTAGDTLRAVLMALLIALGFAVAAAISQRTAPEMISPAGSGTRYTWIPSALIVLAAVLSTRRSAVGGAVLAVAFAMLALHGFSPVAREKFNFRSYLAYSRVVNVAIPIAPAVTAHPAWALFDRTRRHEPPRAMPDAVFEGGSLATDPPPSFTVNCPGVGGVGHLGLKVFLDRQTAGPVTARIAPLAGPSGAGHSLTRWFPGGPFEGDFAFPLTSDRVAMTITAGGAGPADRVAKARAYCLPD